MPRSESLVPDLFGTAAGILHSAAWVRRGERCSTVSARLPIGGDVPAQELLVLTPEICTQRVCGG